MIFQIQKKDNFRGQPCSLINIGLMAYLAPSIFFLQKIKSRKGDLNISDKLVLVHIYIVTDCPLLLGLACKHILRQWF